MNSELNNHIFDALPERFIVRYKNKYIPFEKIDDDTLDKVSYKSLLLDNIIDDICVSSVYINHDETSFKLTRRVFNHINAEVFENCICSNHFDMLYKLYKIADASMLCSYFNLGYITPFTFSNYKQTALNLFKSLSEIQSYDMLESRIFNNSPSQLPVYYKYKDINNKQEDFTYRDIIKDIVAYILDQLTFSIFSKHSTNTEATKNLSKEHKQIYSYICKNIENIDWKTLDYLVYSI